MGSFDPNGVTTGGQTLPLWRSFLQISFPTYLLYLELCLLTAPDSVGWNRAWLPWCVKASAGIDPSTANMGSLWYLHGPLIDHSTVPCWWRVIGSYQLSLTNSLSFPLWPF